ncbi:putative GTP-binding protein di-Ras1 [Penaeus vannamei]|uniref:Putative GTP-binding protein di-Ras1 n=1 Tax=Penaeus vannamei TaxID=6689 RepID=A0A3R7MD16_PENVA|nr:putative GTP-binding protein di-Ras1 [Penaeus vannamei]
MNGNSRLALSATLERKAATTSTGSFSWSFPRSVIFEVPAPRLSLESRSGSRRLGFRAPLSLEKRTSTHFPPRRRTLRNRKLHPVADQISHCQFLLSPSLSTSFSFYYLPLLPSPSFSLIFLSFHLLHFLLPPSSSISFILSYLPSFHLLHFFLPPSPSISFSFYYLPLLPSPSFSLIFLSFHLLHFLLLPSSSISFISLTSSPSTSFSFYYLPLHLSPSFLLPPSPSISFIPLISLSVHLLHFLTSFSFIFSYLPLLPSPSFSLTPSPSISFIFSYLPLLPSPSGFDNVPCVLVGNKVDLSAEREVTWEEANNYVTEAMLNAAYVDTSAKYNLNVTLVFKELLVLTFGIGEEKRAAPLAHPPVPQRPVPDHAPSPPAPCPRARAPPRSRPRASRAPAAASPPPPTARRRRER